jgi:hypothetical protein
MIKLSPMLDWRKAVEDIGRRHVSAVHIVSVNNECKELILKVKGSKGEKVKESKGEKAKETKVVCMNLQPDGSRECFEFDADAPSPNKILHSSRSTLHFLYSPNASIMKAGCFELLAERFGVTPLHQNSHLFVSEQEVSDFPGRGFIIERITSMNKRELKESLAGLTQANIAVRNFPISAEELRRRLKLRDGGDVYIFATTIENLGHRLLICRKIS